MQIQTEPAAQATARRPPAKPWTVATRRSRLATVLAELWREAMAAYEVAARGGKPFGWP